MKHILGPNSRSTLTNVQEGDSQPNAVDLRLDKVFKILPNLFEITNEYKKHRGAEEVIPDEEGFFSLEPGSYEVTFNNDVSICEGECGWTVLRSTLLRNACTLFSGIFDAGFAGKIGSVLHVNVGPMRIKKDTRVAQFVLFDAETSHLYDGSYGLDSSGKPKADEAKYHA